MKGRNFIRKLENYITSAKEGHLSHCVIPIQTRITLSDGPGGI
jgi:hypothetical protein